MLECKEEERGGDDEEEREEGVVWQESIGRSQSIPAKSRSAGVWVGLNDNRIEVGPLKRSNRITKKFFSS